MAANGNDSRGLPGSLGVYGERNHIALGGWPFNFGPARYADGSVGTPNPPVAPPGNPWIDPTTGERYPGAPGA